ncbi:MAG: hypothetical protein EOM11_05855 [Erysipelotrichia bacterium]|nr:hypothetical protein [Erysipelotrichia bacterium]
MKSVNKITALNIGSTILLQGIVFFTTPIFTRMLGAGQYGVFSVFNSWVAILTCVLGLGVNSTLGTGRYQFRESYFAFRSSVLLFSTLISGIMIGVGIIFIKPLSGVLKYGNMTIIILFLSAFAHNVVNFVQNACVYEKRAGTNFFLSVFLSISTVGLSLIMIPMFSANQRYMGRVYGTALPYIVIAFVLWMLTYLKKPTGLCKKYCKYGFVIGLPVVFHMLAQNVLSQSDRVMMQYMNVSDSEIGIYSLFYTFVAVVSTILNALNTSWCPFYYDDVDSENWSGLKVKCKNYIELFTVVTAGFLLLSREVSYVLAGEEYWGGISVIPILVCAVYFTFMYQFPVNFEFFHRKTQIVAMGTLGSALVNIILNLIMIPIWGMYGAAIATALSYGALFVLHYVIVTHMKEHPYHLKASVFIPGMLIVGVAVILFYLLSDFWYIRWVLGAAIGVYELRNIIKRKTIF